MENKRKEKIQKKKLLKERDLSDAAYELFTTKGIQDTAIDDIVKKAGVAKGTFYLYFKDKYDIIDRIILKKSSIVLREAMENTLSKDFESFIDGMIYFIDYIIEYFKTNRKLLRLMYKNLSWGLYRKAIANPDEYNELKEISDLLTTNLKSNEIDDQDFETTLFMIIELTSSVCYSSIILEEPKSIDSLKPALFKMIRKMLSPSS